jgi:hypothetical protein
MIKKKYCCIYKYISLMKRIFFFLCIFNTFLFAQEKETNYKYWLNFGIGGQHELSSSFALNYNFSIEKHFLQAGYHFSGAIINLNGGFLQPSGGNILHAYNISYGERLMSNYFLSAAFIGPSLVTGKVNNQADNISKSYTTIGLSIEAQWIFRAANELGLGIEFYGNLNRYQNISAISFIIYLSNNK